jgi:SAM-dependent methyltransferase
MEVSPFVYDHLVHPKWLMERYLKRHLDKAENYSDKVVLEVGCGTGNNAFAFSSDLYQGLDIDVRRIEYAKAKHPEYHFTVMDRGLIPNDIDCADVILLSSVIHHISDHDMQNYIQQLGDVLSPGGLFVVCEPVLLEKPITNTYMKFVDAGRYLRTPNEYRLLFRNYLIENETIYRRCNLYNMMFFTARAV